MRDSRALIGPFARERAGWRSCPHLALAGATFLLIYMSMPALAAHCPRGEIWMRHAHVCVGRHQHAAQVVREEPSHKGIVYVHVVQPPERPDPPPPPPPPPIEIPYTLPGSIMSRAFTSHFERIPQ
jgi:hypothetical protein